MSTFIELITTFESSDNAKKLAKELLEAKLGACCSIEKVESLYRWKGKVETAEEYQLTVKTKESLVKNLETFILENHPYETPQIITVPILGGSKDYLDWLDEETK